LGTSTGKEFRDYFQAKKLVDFVREDVADDDQIDMVFNKKRADDRKTWLSQYDRSSFLDTTKPTVSYRDFIHKEMIHFSNYDNDRSLPNLMDGLKISLRKILFSAFKRKLTSEIKVAQFSGYVSEHSGYHHGEASLNAAIVGMAQDFVGSNNINLFVPNGQFGTRLQGGKDSASERYIFTQLNPITRFIYPEADDQVLSYKVDDGQKVEPKYYAPIIPMLLVNGSTGIGTGFSTNVMTYNPQDIINRLRHLLKTGNTATAADIPIRPYSEGFTGEITMEDDKYVISGKYEVKDATHIHISELPIGTWTDSFKEHLEKCLDGTARGSKAKDGNPHIKSYMDMSTDTVVSISVTFAKGSIEALTAEQQPYGKNGIDKLLGLYTTHSRNNMYMFDADEKLVKYSSAEEILDAFIPTRLKMYELRKAAQIDKLEHELCEVSNKAKFIKYNLQDKIDLRRKSEQQVVELLTKHKFDKKDDSFNYLRKLPMDSVTEEKVKQLLKEEKDKQEELAELSGKTEKQIWLEELEVLDAKYAEFREAKKLSESDDQPKLKLKGATKAGAKKRVVKKKIAKA
jgi:DNA topoisomerase-2